MQTTSSVVGLAVIVVLYVGIGFLAAAGSVYVAKWLCKPKAEQIFFATVLIPIAGVYLAFTAHFGDSAAWRSETTAVAVFALLGLVGIRVPLVLALGYLLHGLWDGLHELEALGISIRTAGEVTPVPLAYGYFCATFDFVIAAYFFARRHAFRAAWRGAPEPEAAGAKVG